MRSFIRPLFAGLLLVVSFTATASAEKIGLKPLIAPQELSTLQSNPKVVILDIRGEEYATGHVPGAISAPYGKWRGPDNNPGQTLSDAQLTELFRSLGIDAGEAVVVTYQGKDTTDFGSAARVYWTLKSAGVEEISILNGGINAWTKAGLALSKEAVTAKPSDITVKLSSKWLSTREDVQAMIEGKQKAQLVDSRPEAFYKGETKHAAASRPGTLPHATLFSHSNWFNASSPAIIDANAARSLAANAGYTKADDTLVSFCNTGHWAATNWFALSELAGAKNATLYPESMVGWSQAGLPMQNTPSLIENLLNKVTGSR